MTDYLDLSGLERAVDRMGIRGRHLVEAIAHELRNEVLENITGSAPRTGREYPIPGTGRTYTASAPGEPHAEREGVTANAWQVIPPVAIGDRVVGGIMNDHMTEDGHSVAALMELGTAEIEPRPTAIPALDAVAARYGARRRGGAE